MLDLIINGGDAHETRWGIVSPEGGRIAFYVPTPRWERYEIRRQWLIAPEYRNVTQDVSFVLQVCRQFGKKITSNLESEVRLKTKDLEIDEAQLPLGREKAVLLLQIGVLMRVDSIIPRLKWVNRSLSIEKSKSLLISEKLLGERIYGFDGPGFSSGLAARLRTRIMSEYEDAKRKLEPFVALAPNSGERKKLEAYGRADMTRLENRLREAEEDPIKTLGLEKKFGIQNRK